MAGLQGDGLAIWPGPALLLGCRVPTWGLLDGGLNMGGGGGKRDRYAGTEFTLVLVSAVAAGLAT